MFIQEIFQYLMPDAGSVQVDVVFSDPFGCTPGCHLTAVDDVLWTVLFTTTSACDVVLG